MKIQWSPEAIDSLNLDMERKNQFEVLMKCESGYDLPLSARTSPPATPTEAEAEGSA